MVDERFEWLTLGSGALGLVLLAGGLATGWGPLVGWALGMFGAQYALIISAQGRSFDEATPIYAAEFFLVGELAFWSVERRVAAWTEPWLLLRRLAYVGGACAGAAGVAGALLVAAAMSRGGGIALEALGVAAAVGTLALLTLLVRRPG